MNQPKPGKKLGSVKTDSNEYIAVEPNDLRLFQPGMIYDVDIETITFKDGGGMKKFVSMAPGQPAGHSIVPPTAHQSPAAFAQAVWSQSPAEARKALEMGVMGFLARYYAGAYAAGLPAPVANEIAALARGYKLGWEAGLNGGALTPAAPSAADPSDPIPF